MFSGSGNLDKQTGKGSTALHYCCLTDNNECLKLLLRGKASIEIGEQRRGPARGPGVPPGVWGSWPGSGGVLPAPTTRWTWQTLELPRAPRRRESQLQDGALVGGTHLSGPQTPETGPCCAHWGLGNLGEAGEPEPAQT